MDGLRLTYTPSHTETMQVAVALQNQRYRPAERWRMTGIAFTACLLGGAFAGALGIALSRIVPVVPVWISVPIFLVLMVLGPYQRGLKPWLVHKSGEMIDAASPPLETRFVADGNGARWSDDVSDYWVAWQGVERLFATPTNLAFMCGAMAFVLPLSLFESNEERKAFMEFVLSRLTPEAAAASHRDGRIAALL
jgi:hypothetical protein